jgi:hypothetical protein
VASVLEVLSAELVGSSLSVELTSSELVSSELTSSELVSSELVTSLLVISELAGSEFVISPSPHAANVKSIEIARKIANNLFILYSLQIEITKV